MNPFLNHTVYGKNTVTPIVLLPYIFVPLIFCAGLIFAQPSDSKPIGDQRPNILFIFLDDLGEEALGAYEPETYDTPRMDELAESGLTFRHGYSMSQCFHSRVSVTTGTYASRFAPVDWGTFPESFPAEKTIGRVMQEAGYRTAVAGKWQLTLLQSDPDHPHELGFDEYMLHGWHEGPRYWNPFIWKNGEKKRYVGKYGPDLFTDYLIDFMRRQKDSDQPFFAWYSMTLPHIVGDDWNLDEWQPSVPPPHGPKGRYETLEEMITEIDEKVGQIVWALEQMNMREDTLIVLTSDNGTADKHYAAYRNGRFVKESPKHPGEKGSLREGGIHVPFIVSWKGTVEPGTTDALVDLTDLLPTFAELGGVDLSNDDYPYDGKSFVPTLRNPEMSPRQWIVAENFPPTKQRIVRDHRWKLYSGGNLFDMKNDPDEQDPVKMSELKPDQKKRVSKLKEVLKEIGPR